MHASTFVLALAAAFAAPSVAFIRFTCSNPVVEERADPIISPGIASGHVHKIAGGNSFNFTMDYAEARASSCSSCPIKQDLSNYWTPKLYYHAENGSFISVPVANDNSEDLNGGMTVYYLQRGPSPSTLKAFPKGFRMVAGNPFKRNFTGGFDAQAISFACLGAGEAETNNLPDYNCPDGLRAQVFFPSCWDGKNLDSPDHTSHMSYPESGAYNAGPCPASHPVQLISLFYEVLYDSNVFVDMWYGSKQPFVFAMGDATGYGFHGDFVNGWDVPTLQNIVDNCDDTTAQGSIATEYCPIIEQFTGDEMSECRIPALVNEEVHGLLSKLPGCNPVTHGPAQAVPEACAAVKLETVEEVDAEYYKDMRKHGWAFRGCAPDDGTTRTLDASTSMYSAGMGPNMTIENCIAFCDGYMYAGLEYGQQCFCGNSIPADRTPVASTANCEMPCAGNSAEYCGGSLQLSIYKKCTGKCLNKVKRDGSDEYIYLDADETEVVKREDSASMVEPMKRDRAAMDELAKHKKHFRAHAHKGHGF